MAESNVTTDGRWLRAYARPGWWAGVFALWTAFGVLMVGHVQVRFGGDPMITRLPSIVPFYWAWVPLMPLVVELAVRFDFRPGDRIRSLLAHGTAAAMMSVAHSFLYSIYRWLVPLDEPAGWAAALIRTVSRHTVGDVTTYAAVAGAILVVLQYHQTREREREAARATVRASRLEAQLSAARLDALQMQLHPHFLFNTLNSISVLVLKGENTLAIRAIRQLGDLLRTTLQTARGPERSLEEEIAFVGRYLEIEQLRFGGNLRVDVQIDDDLATALVPHLILQPLIENAIVHGLGASSGPGAIRVVGRRDNGNLRLEVWDNGAGVAAGRGDLATGVGLTNTRARLRELYGESACLSLAPATGGGTVAAIDLPYHAESGAGGEGASA